MTEEDTFRILKRRSYEEVDPWIMHWALSHYKADRTSWYDSQEVLEYLHTNGWKGREYCIEFAGEKDFYETFIKLAKDSIVWNDV
jgi:hypothetical protein